MTAADPSSSFLAGPHQGLRRNAARTALELFPGITTYCSDGWGRQRAEAKCEVLRRLLLHYNMFFSRRAFLA